MQRGLLLLILLAGCGSSSGPELPPPVCVPNASYPCACPAGSAGSHACLSDGSGYGICSCAPIVPDYAAALQGNWIVFFGDVCMFALNFEGGRYSQNLGCLDTSNALQMESYQGTFTADATNVYVTVDHATCPVSQPAGFFPYTATAKALTVTFGSDLYVLGRNAAAGGDPGSGAVIHLGCYSADGKTFTPAALAPI